VDRNPVLAGTQPLPCGHRPQELVDTERQFSQNRRLALERLRQRIEHDERAAGRAVTKASWRIHDEIVRGNPIRIERPDPPTHE
jgi:peptide chain release factor